MDEKHSEECRGQDYLASEPWEISDFLWALGLGLFAFVLHRFGLGALEFFRHTEADRVLIGWEMAERKDYLVPHLVGSPILTKPPLFYWLIAEAISFFGRANEATVRLPSVIAATVFVFAQFFFLRAAGFARVGAAIGSFMLATAGMIFVQAPTAEIDMVFSVFCALSMYCGFLGNMRRSYVLTVVAYFLAALAFLTKGPPIIFFLGATQLLFFMWYWRAEPKGTELSPTWARFIKMNLLGVLVFCGIVGAWALALIYRVGWEEITRYFEIEFIRRVIQDDKDRHRGIFFYVGAGFNGLLPWALFILAPEYLLFRRKTEFTKQVQSNRSYYYFLVFNLIALIACTAMMSLSSGKSHRYFLPVLAFGVNLCLCGYIEAFRSELKTYLAKVMKVVLPLLIVVVLVGPYFVNLYGVNPKMIWIASWLLAASLVVCACGVYGRKSVISWLGVALLMLGARYAYAKVYAPARNAKNSVQYIAQSIDMYLPKGEPVYNIELFERWVSYYLKRMGRNSYRLDVERCQEMSTSPGFIYMLINLEEESWRVDKLRQYDPALKVVLSYEKNRNPLALVRVSKQALAHLNPSKPFPTVPTPPS